MRTVKNRKDEYLSGNFVEMSNQKIIENYQNCGLENTEEDHFLVKFFQISKEIFEITINDKKFEKIYKNFFDSQYIFGMEMEDLQLLVSAEYVAYVFTRMGIFTKEVIIFLKCLLKI